jgi:hypothetical protein
MESSLELLIKVDSNLKGPWPPKPKPGGDDGDDDE